MFNIGMPELILILVIALVIFGPKKLPEVGKAIGSGVKEFKRAIDGLQKSIEVEETSPQEEKKAEPQEEKKAE